MKLSEIKAVVVEDKPIKSAEIDRALRFCGIRNIVPVGSQDRVWEEIDKGNASGEKVGLIVTDMNYPLVAGGDHDSEAGWKLIERMKAEGVNIPVVICSSLNYNEPEILGSVWYREWGDLEFEFMEVLKRLEK